MLAIIIPTMIATVAFAWWFRRGNTKATYRPDWEYSGAIEMVVWAIPALTIMLLGGIAWIGSHDLEPSKPLKSDDAAAQGRGRLARLEMAVHLPRPGHRDGQPAGRSGRHAGQLPADLGDGLERFFVPQMGTMIYTMPRMTTRLNLQADRQGVYDGLSAHFSGDGFPGMQFKVHVAAADQFAMWAQGARGQGAALDGRSLCRAVEAQQLCEADDLRRGRARPVRRDRRRTARRRTRCRRRHNQPAPDRGHERCSASSPGTRSRSTSRSR